MKFERFTKMSYEEAVKTKQSPEYIRLALYEDGIENKFLLSYDSIMNAIEKKLQDYVLMSATWETVDTDLIIALRWLRKNLKNLV